MASVGFASSATTASAMRVWRSASPPAHPRSAQPTARAALPPKAHKSVGSILPPCGCCQPFVQFRPSPPPRDVAYSNRDCLLLADQHDEALPSGHASVEQVALEHRVVLGQTGDHDSRIF